MPSRRDVFIDNGIYHIFNKTLDRNKIFLDPRNCSEFIARLCYYRSSAATMRYAFYKALNPERRAEYQMNISAPETFAYEIICYCLMPNHFHLLVRQKGSKTINKYVSNVVNSFTRFHNLKSNRHGPLFLPQFGSRMIVSDEQFIHTTRYIHLNPYTAGLVHSFNGLINFTYSSYRAYVRGLEDGITQKETLHTYMRGNMQRYQRFVEDNAEHQRTLDWIKHAETGNSERLS